MNPRSLFFAFAAITAFLFLVSSGVSALTNVTACGQAIDVAGEYYVLNQSLNSSTTCITIGADNITLDCSYYGATYNITGTQVAGTAGIYFRDKTGVTVKNCVLLLFESGVSADASSSGCFFNSFLNNTSNNHTSFGFLLSTFSSDLVNNTANYNWEGFRLRWSGTNNSFTNNFANYNQYGFELFSGSNNSFVNNTVTGSGNDGFYLRSASAKNSSFVNNTISSSGNHGFYLSSSPNSSFVNNTVTSSGTYGFYLSSSSNNSFADNTVTGSGNHGFYLSSSLNNTFTENLVAASNADSTGFYFYNSNYSIASNNSVSASGSGASYAVYLRDSQLNSFGSEVLNASSAGVADVYVQGIGVNNFTNCSFNKSDTAFYSGATGGITVFWYVDANVTDANGNALANAAINASDVNGTSVFNASTNASGWIPRQTVLEYYQNITGIYNATPHWFNASKAGYDSNQTPSNVNTNFALSRALTWARGVDLSTPLNNSFSSSYAQVFCFTPNSTRALVNASVLVAGVVVATNSSDLVNASSNCVNYTFAGAGVYSWSVAVYDSAGSIESVARVLTIIESVGGGGGSTPTPTPAPMPSSEPTVVVTPAPAVSPGVSPEPSIAPTQTPSPSPSVKPGNHGSLVSEVAKELRTGISSVQDLIAIAKSQGKNVRDAESLLDLAQQAFEAGDYATASEYMRQTDAALNKAGVVANGVSSAGGFDWTLAGIAAVIVVALAGAAALFVFRKRKHYF